MKANVNRVNREYYDALLKKENFIGSIESIETGLKE
jgi:hypothetical protein